MAEMVERINKFSHTPLGGILLSLVFGTVVGGLVTNYYGHLRDQENADRNSAGAGAAERQALVDSLTMMIAERRTGLGNVVDAIQHDASNERVTKAFEKYNDASSNYNNVRAGLITKMNLQLGTGAAGAFIIVLDTNVTPSFTRLGECVTSAYYTYDKGDNAGAKARLSECETRDGRRQFSYATETTKLKHCIGSFNNLLGDAVTVENGFALMPLAERSQKIDVTSLDNLKCSETDFVCRKALAEKQLKSGLKADCGKLATKPNYIE